MQNQSLRQGISEVIFFIYFQQLGIQLCLFFIENMKFKFEIIFKEVSSFCYISKEISRNRIENMAVPKTKKA